MTKDSFKKIIGYIACSLLKVDFTPPVKLGLFAVLEGKDSISIKRNVSIGSFSYLSCNKDGHLIVGENSIIRTRTRISCANRIEIGSNVVIAQNCHISDQAHDYTDINVPIGNQRIIVYPGDGIKIDDNSFIGMNSVLIGAIRIGKGCMIGANSVIKKDIPDYCVAAGNPARIIKRYDFSQKKWISSPTEHNC